MLYLQTLSGLENILKNCSEYLPDDKKIERPPPTDVETYYDKDMVSFSLFRFYFFLE